MLCPACSHDNIDGADTCEECFADLRSEGLSTTPRSAVEAQIIEMPVKKLVASQPPRLPAGSSLREAIQKMQVDRAGCVLVVGDRGEVTGILTERDVFKRIAAVDGIDLDVDTVGQYATPSPQTIRSDQTLQYALHLMAINEFRHLPVEYEDGVVGGLVTARDILNFIETSFRATVTRAFRRSDADFGS